MVMATGSGKTRTVIALVDVLLQHRWVKNVLFLADRNSLLIRAKRNFVTLLPDMSVMNLCEEKDDYMAHCAFFIYQTMMNYIDSGRTKGGGCSPWATSTWSFATRHAAKYWDIFNYFDASLVGLTAPLRMR